MFSSFVFRSSINSDKFFYRALKHKSRLKMSWFEGGQYEKETRIDGKIAVITGGK